MVRRFVIAAIALLGATPPARADAGGAALQAVVGKVLATPKEIASRARHLLE